MKALSDMYCSVYPYKTALRIRGGVFVLASDNISLNILYMWSDPQFLYTENQEILSIYICKPKWGNFKVNDHAIKFEDLIGSYHK